MEMGTLFQAMQFEGFESFTVSKGRSALYWADLIFLAALSPVQGS